MTAADLAARRAAAASVLADYKAELASAPLSRPPDRSWMLRLARELENLVEALDAAALLRHMAAAYGREDARMPQPNAAPAAPLETERQARELPAVRAVYDAFDADPGPGKMAPYNLAMLLGACADAGVAVGGYDSRILHWLAQWEPTTCAAVAGLISRAHAAGQDGAR